jgi:carbohydrate-selective porin OprB
MTGGYRNGFALNLGWQPKKSGTLIPSLDLGWGYNAVSYQNLNWVASTRNSTGGNASAASGGNIAGNLNDENISATQSWTVALQWKDAFRKGNSLGMAVGQPTFVTSTRNGTTPFDGNYAWEWWYNYKVSDNISVAPILFYLSNPSSLGVVPGATNPNVFGGLMTARFRF